MDKSELRTKANIIQKIFSIYQHTVDEECTDAVCDRLIADTAQIWKESGEDQLVMEIIVAFVNDIERHWKQAQAKCG